MVLAGAGQPPEDLIDLRPRASLALHVGHVVGSDAGDAGGGAAVRPAGVSPAPGRVVDAERRLPGLELDRPPEAAHDVLAVGVGGGVGGHAVPPPDEQLRRATGDDRIDPLGEHPIAARHLGDRIEGRLQGLGPLPATALGPELLRALAHPVALSLSGLQPRRLA